MVKVPRANETNAHPPVGGGKFYHSQLDKLVHSVFQVIYALADGLLVLSVF